MRPSHRKNNPDWPRRNGRHHAQPDKYALVYETWRVNERGDVVDRRITLPDGTPLWPVEYVDREELARRYPVKSGTS